MDSEVGVSPLPFPFPLFTFCTILIIYLFTVEHTNVRVCLYIAYIACGSALLYIETMYLFLAVLALSAAAIVNNIKICFDGKTPQFAIFGTRVIFMFYSISICFCNRNITV